ncbi:MAG: bifunctional diaminohydroxyphosphoribosylaminopyrimidine deaminase/5-amino-6-(5-phosphoribosylamino)uracil reductase RibD [Planctomycetota bacterium]
MSDKEEVMSDEIHMTTALRLAARGEGHVEPNPMVGCVIVRPGQPNGEGFHASYGGLHAERNAMASVLPPDKQHVASMAQIDPNDTTALHGATWYVTLEPCCHTGKTPPCADAIIACRPQRVVIAATDPNPRVAGGGIQRLRDAGIHVDVGVCADAAIQLTAPFRKRQETGLPWVIAKWAMTLDGRIATDSGHSQWISGAASRRDVHQTRARVDAIAVGGQTVFADDCLLNARPDGNDPVPRIAKRAVFATTRLPQPESRLIRSLAQGESESDAVGKVLLFAGGDADSEAMDTLRELHVEIHQSSDSPARFPIKDALRILAQQDVTNLVVEGGGNLLGQFADQRLIDELHIYVAGKILGGQQNRSPIHGNGVHTMPDADHYTLRDATPFENDVRLRYFRT